MTVPMLPTTVRPGPPVRLFRSVAATATLSATLFGPAGYLVARSSGSLGAVPRGFEAALTGWWVVAVVVVVSALVSARRQPRRVRLVPAVVQSAVRRVVEVSSFGCGTLLRWTTTHPETDLGALLVQPSPEPEMDSEPEHPGPEGRTPEAKPAPTAASAVVSHRGRTVEHRVERADTWWILAERSLGDGRRWRTIVDLNLGREVAPDTFVTDDSVLRRDWLVLLPAPDTEESTR